MRKTADKKRRAFKNTLTLRLSFSFLYKRLFEHGMLSGSRFKIIALIQTRKSGSDYAFQHDTLDPKIYTN